jgi:hypothetical protein
VQGELTIPEAQRALVERQQAEARERRPAPVTEPVPLPSAAIGASSLIRRGPSRKSSGTRVRRRAGAGLPHDDVGRDRRLASARLAEPDGCHIYLWTTQKFLPGVGNYSKRVGVRYQCTFGWCKNVGFTPFRGCMTWSLCYLGALGI